MMNWVSGVCRGIVHLGEKITGLQVLNDDRHEIAVAARNREDAVLAMMSKRADQHLEDMKILNTQHMFNQKLLANGYQDQIEQLTEGHHDHVQDIHANQKRLITIFCCCGAFVMSIGYLIYNLLQKQVEKVEIQNVTLQQRCELQLEQLKQQFDRERMYLYVIIGGLVVILIGILIYLYRTGHQQYYPNTKKREFPIRTAQAGQSRPNITPRREQINNTKRVRTTR